MEKLVSVIVPVYNAEQYLEECLTSIINQTYSKIEIIIINDGSTDLSEQIVLTLQKNSKIDIKYKKQENSGVGQARNVGIKEAHRRVYCFC